MATSLDGVTVGISISDSPDLAEMGLSERHLEDAMTGVARHLLAAGAKLVYGGDLREGSFTDLLFEFIAMYHKPRAERNRTSVTNVFAWPVHVSIERKELSRRVKALESLGAVIFLDAKGKPIHKERAIIKAELVPQPAEWRSGLTNLRKQLTKMCDARILLGGRVTGYKGVMPGIAEEALLSIKARKPTYLVGGFGGCVRDILMEMQFKIESQVSRSIEWNGCNVFQSFNARDLRCGLNLRETQRLASTKHVDEIVTLLLRGLGRRIDPISHKRT